MVDAECLSLDNYLKPAIVDLRLACSNAFLLRGNPHRAINQLTPLHQLVRRVSQLNGDGEYRRVAWCNALSRAWMAAYKQDLVFCYGMVRDGEAASMDLENGLLQCLSLNCEFNNKFYLCDYGLFSWSSVYLVNVHTRQSGELVTN